jgi:hypothetical protein
MGQIESSQAYLTRQAAAVFLQERGFPVAVKTLAQLAWKGGGPKFKIFGRRPLYNPIDLLSWAEGRCTGPRRSTSEQTLTVDNDLRTAATPALLSEKAAR